MMFPSAFTNNSGNITTINATNAVMPSCLAVVTNGGMSGLIVSQLSPTTATVGNSTLFNFNVSTNGTSDPIYCGITWGDTTTSSIQPMIMGSIAYGTIFHTYLSPSGPTPFNAHVTCNYMSVMLGGSSTTPITVTSS